MKSKLQLFTICLGAALAGVGPSAMAQTLTHRYSFNDLPGASTLTDSVGGAAWDGTVYVDSLFPGGAYLDGSQLQLTGQGGYGILPSGLVSGYSAVTIEFWASLGANPTWTRVWAFGNQNAGAEDTGIDYCHYAGGNYQNLAFHGGGTNAYVNNSGGLNNAQNVHVTCVVNPANNQMLYYNGTAVKSGSLNGALKPLNTIVDDYGLIGRSLQDVDATLLGSVNEFRVYNGVLPKAQVALNDAAGPDNYVTEPGALLSLELQSPAGTIQVRETSTQVFKGTFANVTGLDLIAYGGATFQSQDAAVLTVSAAGVVTGTGPGTTGVIASYGGLSATNQITVVGAVPAVLQHRYSFTADASDSVGDAHGTIQGGALISGGKVILGGTNSQHVSLPGPAINIRTNKAVTIEAWVDFRGIGNWCRLWDFGAKNGTGASNEVYFAPRSTSAQHRITENGTSTTLTWAGSLTNWSGQVTCVIDPPTSTMAIYRNGVLECALYNAASPLSFLSTELAVIGRSLVDADPYMNASVNEFRIYSGALSPEEIALTYANGPDSTARDPGELESIEVAPLVYPANAGQMAPVILANYENLTGFNLLPNNAARPAGLVVTSSDTNVIRVVANNLLQTFGPGQATLSARYLGRMASAVVQVGNKAQLTHRYSFSANANDSVGTAHGSLQQNATISGGKLVLDGTTNYLRLPAWLLQGYDAVTIDTWVDFGAGANWARLWYFGGNTTSGNVTDEFYLTPRISTTAHRYSSGFPHNSTTRDLGPVWQNQSLHITATFGNGTMALYTNGVLHDTVTTAARPDQIGGWVGWIGRSPYSDPYMNCSVDEFRVYNGRLSPQEIQASHVLGPDALLSSTPPTLAAAMAGGSVTLKWPVAAAGFTVQAKESLAAGSWVIVTNAPALVGSEWQLSLPASASGQFFRLWR
jgi:hypothetical protein